MDKDSYLKHPVAKAVKPLKVKAIEYAEIEAHKEISDARETLEANGWSLLNVAPAGDYRKDPEREYKAKNNRRAHFLSFVERHPDHPYRYVGTDLYIVRMSQEKCTAHIEMAKRLAAMQYDAFVMKLVHKVGPCIKAKLEGDHIWGESFLTVTFANKPNEVWKTKQIYNRSKHGKWFPQWPSRIVRGSR
jgi:hypothetical protein